MICEWDEYHKFAFYVGTLEQIIIKILTIYGSQNDRLNLIFGKIFMKVFISLLSQKLQHQTQIYDIYLIHKLWESASNYINKLNHNAFM